MSITPSSPGTLSERGQIRILIVCALVALCDGYDTQAVAFIAPAIISQWDIASSAFGPVFSSGLAGLAIGAFACGPIADRWGRKIVIMLCIATFGVASIATTWSTTIFELAAWRAVTGIGLGGVLPNLITATNEAASARFKKVAVMLMICGFPLGATFAGFVGAPLIEWGGWKTILILGGIIPLALLPALHLVLPPKTRPSLPENQAADESRIAALSTEAFGVTALFTDGLAIPTILIWTAFFSNLLVLYCLMNWLPALLSLGGSSLSVATLCTALLNLGGVAGALSFAQFINRPRFSLYLATAYIGCILCILVIVYRAEETGLLMVSAAFAGGVVIGGQMAMNALAASLYPDGIRSTGVGWALGFGRIGSIAGPLAGSALIDRGWQGTSPLLAASLPLVVAALALVSLWITLRRSGIFAPAS
ncbi:MFS transporter [Sphingobium sp. EP60837]|uniref:MFS transporter n=1 Tax=Sphingobium sp. EP60837 TaxID=1855519 RepID=UPI0018D4128B|nr:aromatic acid/H+ symport family MFS transporter [Sphingobium sp. EP60837]